MAVHMDAALPKPTFFLLSFLSSITQRTGSARVKVANLCAVTRNDERTTRRQIRELVELGYLLVDRKDSTTYVYRLTEKSLILAPKRPDREKPAIGDCECRRKSVRLTPDGVCFACARESREKAAYARVQQAHPDWSHSQISSELLAEKAQRKYSKAARDLKFEQGREERLAERFTIPEAG